MMDEYSRLLAFQQTLEKETTDRIEFFGLSVDETIKKCLLNSMSKRADKLKSDFKVPDKRFTTSSPPSPRSSLTKGQILVPETPRADCHPRLRGLGGIFAVKAEPDWVRGVREAPRREGPPEGSRQLRAALRWTQTHRFVR